MCTQKFRGQVKMPLYSKNISEIRRECAFKILLKLYIFLVASLLKMRGKN